MSGQGKKQKQRVEALGSDEQVAPGFQSSRLSKENFSVGETGLDLSCYSFWLGAAKAAVRKSEAVRSESSESVERQV